MINFNVCSLRIFHLLPIRRIVAMHKHTVSREPGAAAAFTFAEIATQTSPSPAISLTAMMATATTLSTPNMGAGPEGHKW